jgi:hypothetical protein
MMFQPFCLHLKRFNNNRGRCLSAQMEYSARFYCGSLLPLLKAKVHAKAAEDCRNPKR